MKFERLISIILLGAILGLLALDVYRITLGVRQPNGAHDLHPYWYRGHSLRQGLNPYRASLENEIPSLPVTYLDGVITQQPPIAQPGLPTFISNTAPLSLFLFSFSLYSWPFAKWLWVAINLLLILILPWLVLRSFPYDLYFKNLDRLIIFAIAFAFGSTRGSVMIGQTSLIVFSLLLGSLILREHHWLISGILMGIALSKYSLALPFVLFMLLELRPKNFVLLIVALIVQFFGVITLSYASGESPTTIFQDYIQVFKQISASHDRSGVQISTLLPPDSQLVIPIIGVISVVVLVVLLFGLWQRRKMATFTIPLLNYHLLAILIIWTFLIAYHGGYDLIMLLVLLPLFLFALRRPEFWRFTDLSKWLLAGILFLFIGMMCVPNSLVQLTIQKESDLETMLFIERLYVFMLLLLFIAISWMLSRLGSTNEVLEKTNTIPQEVIQYG